MQRDLYVSGMSFGNEITKILDVLCSVRMANYHEVVANICQRNSVQYSSCVEDSYGEMSCQVPLRRRLMKLRKL
jgi:hypothetical protein